MREARAVIIPLMGHKYLGFPFEAAKGGGVNDAVFIALKRAALGPAGLRDTAPAAFGRIGSINGAAANR